MQALAPLFVRPSHRRTPASLALIGTGASDCLDLVVDGGCSPEPLLDRVLDDAVDSCR